MKDSKDNLDEINNLKNDLVNIKKGLEEEFSNFKDANSENGKKVNEAMMNMMDNCLVVFNKLIEFEKENKKILKNQIILNNSYKYIMIVLIIISILTIINIFI